MKILLAVLLLLAPAAARGGSMEDLYLSARDHYIAEFRRTEKTAAAETRGRAERRAMAKLEGQLRALTGPLIMKGLPRRGKTNLRTLLAEDQGFGLLDGIRFTASDGRTSVVVSTEGLFAAWLAGHKNWWEGKDDIPQSAEAAARAEAFYTQGVSAGAAVLRYADLPAVKTASARFVYAMLAARTQSDAPAAPDEIFVVAQQGGRVFVVNAALGSKAGQIAACDALNADFIRQSQEAMDAFQASESKDEKLAVQPDALRAEGESAFKRCYSERAKDQAFFAAAAAQAQALADALPGR